MMMGKMIRDTVARAARMLSGLVVLPSARACFVAPPRESTKDTIPKPRRCSMDANDASANSGRITVEWPAEFVAVADPDIASDDQPLRSISRIAIVSGDARKQIEEDAHNLRAVEESKSVCNIIEDFVRSVPSLAGHDPSGSFHGWDLLEPSNNGSSRWSSEGSEMRLATDAYCVTLGLGDFDLLEGLKSISTGGGQGDAPFGGACFRDFVHSATVTTDAAQISTDENRRSKVSQLPHIPCAAKQLASDISTISFSVKCLKQCAADVGDSTTMSQQFASCNAPQRQSYSTLYSNPRFDAWVCSSDASNGDCWSSADSGGCSDACDQLLSLIGQPEQSQDQGWGNVPGRILAGFPGAYVSSVVLEGAHEALEVATSEVVGARQLPYIDESCVPLITLSDSTGPTVEDPFLPLQISTLALLVHGEATEKSKASRAAYSCDLLAAFGDLDACRLDVVHEGLPIKRTTAAAVDLLL